MCCGNITLFCNQQKGGKYPRHEAKQKIPSFIPKYLNKIGQVGKTFDLKKNCYLGYTGQGYDFKQCLSKNSNKIIRIGTKN